MLRSRLDSSYGEKPITYRAWLMVAQTGIGDFLLSLRWQFVIAGTFATTQCLYLVLI